jgi:L-iditol 2-dehydrogenase
MKAAVLENKEVITYQEVPTPKPRPGHVLLKVKAVSICGSDIMRYVKGHRTYPIILGHECAGVIAEVGEGVSRELVGKHAAVIPLVPCFQCEQCRLGHYSACHSYSFIGSRQPGGFAEFVELPEKNALLVPDELKFESAALIEPSTVARHIIDLGGFVQGQTAIVLGAGSVGLMAVQWLRILGAKLIISTDVVDDNLQAARSLGAHVTLNPKQVDVTEKVKKMTGDGVDLALEVAGVPQTLMQTIQVTRPRGSVVCGGNQPPDVSLPMSFIEEMMRKELRINGCFMSYSPPFPGHEWTESVQMVLNGQLDMDKMISHGYPLSQVGQVFEDIASHKLAYRKIILFPESDRSAGYQFLPPRTQRGREIQ